MSTRQTPQRARLARAIVGRTMAGIMIFTAAFAVAFAAFDAIVKPGLSNFLYFEVMGGDGGASWRLYDALTTLYLPLAALLYAAGIFLFVRSGVNRALSYFDALYEAAEGILAKRAEAAPLPPELSETAAALSAIKEERERADRAAQAAEGRKNELVAYLAHDVKTPLTSMIGYLTLLEESPDLPERTRARYTGVALEKAYRLEGLLDEFFEITRYNLHAIPIERSRFDAALFCGQVIDELFPLAEARNLRLVYEGPQELRVRGCGQGGPRAQQRHEERGGLRRSGHRRLGAHLDRHRGGRLRMVGAYRHRSRTRAGPAAPRAHLRALLPG